MSAVLLIARRELGGYFRSMTGYVIAGLVLLIDGLLFNAFVLSAGESTRRTCCRTSSTSRSARR